MKIRTKLSLLFGLGFMIFAVNLLVGDTGKANAQFNQYEAICGHFSRDPHDWGQMHVATVLRVRNTVTNTYETFNAGGGGVNIRLVTVDTHPANLFGAAIYDATPVLRNISGSNITLASFCRVRCGFSAYGDYFFRWGMQGSGSPDELAFLQAVRGGTWSGGSWTPVNGIFNFRNGIIETNVMYYNVDWTPPPPPPSGGVDIATCSQLKGWAYDPRRWLGQVDVHVYFNAPVGMPGNIGWNIGLANGASPGHGSGSNGFDVNPISQPWLVPILRDGNSHPVYLYGVSASGSFFIGQANIPACPYQFDVQPNPPTVNSDTVSFSATNNGDGQSRYSGNNGVNANINIWVNNVLRVNNELLATPVINPSSTWSADRDISSLGLIAGDIVCASLTINPVRGVTGGVAYGDPPRTAGGLGVGCATKSANPYIQVYSGDVIVGGNFKKADGTCDSSTGGAIKTYSRNNSGLQKGASGQYGVFAKEAISVDSLLTGPKNFTSNSPNGGSTSYTFANSPAGTNGSFGRNSCITDYYAEFDSAPSSDPGSIIILGSLASGVYKHTGNVTLNASNFDDKKLVLLVDGNVTINGNISFNSANIDRTPFLMVVAKGDITINRVVGNISGIYVAQPNGATGGSIITCDEPVTDNLYASCNNKLRVTGSLIAKKMVWRRVSGDVFSNTPDSNRDLNDTSEVIDISPGLYYSTPPVRPKSMKWQYDSIRNLSPVF